MSLDYDSIKSKRQISNRHWAPFGDFLLIGLFVFALLYGVSIFRDSVSTVISNKEILAAKEETQEAKLVLKMYEDLSQSELSRPYSKQTAEAYQNIVDELEMLIESTYDKRVVLENESKVLLEREERLEEYADVIRHILATRIVGEQALKFQDKEILKRESEFADTIRQAASLKLKVAEAQKAYEQMVNARNKKIKRYRVVYKRNSKKRNRMIKRARRIYNRKITAAKQKYRGLKSDLVAIDKTLKGNKSHLIDFLKALRKRESLYKSEIVKMKSRYDLKTESQQAYLKRIIASQRFDEEGRLKFENRVKTNLAKHRGIYRRDVEGLERRLASTKKQIGYITQMYGDALRELESEQSESQKESGEVKEPGNE